MYIEAISNKGIYIEMLNDTFHYFVNGEEPIDEESYREIESYNSLYPDGFFLDRLSAKDLNNGKIGATLYPNMLVYIDAYWQATKYIKLCIKYESEDHISLWWFDEQKNRIEYKGQYEIMGDKKSRYFSTGKNSMYFLGAFTED